ncbi:DUF1579 domain-containing protein [Desertivirga brevis]|uniref:DUF1579 domain-containing protein n=1 Tax=Desertivirga brevis TaxID=2810310 RepID=UPI001A958635|nr:DUF1579 domain-containing protein [Pedobacter sp. SYSU D00873]
MSEKFETSRTTGAHFQLSRLVGKWKGTTKTWFDPSKLEDESAISGTMKLILDGRFIMHEYESSFGDKPITGMAIYGYHLELRKFQCAWIDSFHNGTAMMFSEGKKDEREISVLGGYTYVTPETEQHWGWRTDIAFSSDDEIIITAFNISPEGQEFKATETVYRKVN